jgi:hypothetical protein
MVSFSCLPLSRLCGTEKGNEIFGEDEGNYYYVRWSKTHLAFPKKLLEDVNTNFLKTSEWYPLGSSMTKPIPRGLGDYIQNHQHIWEQHSPRFASMIAAIMVHKKMITFRKNGRAFELRKI